MYKDMADILKPCVVGSAEVDIFEINEKTESVFSVRAGISNGRYARLRVNGSTIMSDTPMERRTNRECVIMSHGDVLIGGLGIGMIIMAIQDKENVTSVTVVEKNPDVIAAIQYQLPLNSKVRIIQGDVYTYKPDMKFDCIYMDIWGDISTDTYEEMQKLKRRYGHYLKPADVSPRRWNICWAEYNAKNGKNFI